MERFSSFDGAQIAYGVLGDEPDAHAAVLCHHGFASTSVVNWIRPGLADAVAGAGRRVVLIDARGHGESDHPHEPEAYANGAMSRDVAALLDHLGLERVDMAGYSMGSFVTLGLAASGDPRLRSIFLGGAGTAQVRTARPEVALAIADGLEADDPSSITGARAKAFRYFADATGQDRLALAAIQRSSTAVDADGVAAIRLPTVVVNGARDTIVGDPGSLARLIPRARSVVVPGNHLSAVTRPEFRDELVTFARAAGAAPGS